MLEDTGHQPIIPANPASSGSSQREEDGQPKQVPLRICVVAVGPRNLNHHSMDLYKNNMVSGLRELD